MNVKQLIEELQKLNPELPVVIHSYTDENLEVDKISIEKYSENNFDFTVSTKDYAKFNNLKEAVYILPPTTPK